MTEKARVSRDPEECHDWRKRAKYLSYHLTLLSPLDPASIGEWAVATGELAGQPGYLEQVRPAQDFLHLEHIDAKKLTSAKAEQQQGEAVVASQARALVDAVEQVM